MKSIFGSKVQYLILAIVVLIFVFFYGMDHCIKEWREKEKEFAGIVTAKYLDSTNSNFFTINVNQSYKYHIVGFGSCLHNKEVYSQISIGDSVVKTKGSYELHVFTKEGQMEFVIDYGCEKDWWRWDQSSYD